MYKSRNCLGQHKKNKFSFPFCHQKHVTRINYDKNRFAHTKLFFKHTKAITVNEINLSRILSLIFEFKSRTAPFVFHNLYTLKPPGKYSLRTDNLLFKPLKNKFWPFFYIFLRSPQVKTNSNKKTPSSITLNFICYSKID